MNGLEHQAYAARSLVEGFVRRSGELGAKSDTMELVLEELLALMAVYRAPPGKEAQYIKSFLRAALRRAARIPDETIKALKRAGANPITDPSVVAHVRRGLP